MNTYKKRNYRGKRGYSGRPHRRAADSYHQPLPPNQNRIPYARHTLTKPDVEAVVDALLSGTLTQGRELERFESLLAKLTHSDFAISFSSGTAAIHAALACLKLEPEDEVITSTLNFCSLTNMISLVGAKPVLVDCDPLTHTISVDAVKEAINENTKAIFANNFAGHPADLSVLREFCDEHHLILLEDASHGLGGKYRGHYVGNQSDLTCFSFHPSKAITTCEGGAVTTGNRSIADWLSQFRHHGIQKDARYFQTDETYPEYYQELQFQGMNYRLSELHAALGRSQLTRLDRHIERRRSIAGVYQQKLESIEEIMLPHSAEWADHAYHLYTVQFVGELSDKRDEIFNAFREEGVDTQVHYVPVHRMPLYAGKLGDPSRFPNAERYFSRALSLPLFPDLSYKEIERITELLIKITSKYVKSTTGRDKEAVLETEEISVEDVVKNEPPVEAPALEPVNEEPVPAEEPTEEGMKSEASGSVAKGRLRTVPKEKDEESQKENGESSAKQEEPKKKSTRGRRKKATTKTEEEGEAPAKPRRRGRPPKAKKAEDQSGGEKPKSTRGSRSKAKSKTDNKEEDA
jgi:dTDP-4-amino-4,6-dideoxygalactose transaminase